MQPEVTHDSEKTRFRPQTVDGIETVDADPSTDPASTGPVGDWPTIPGYAITGEIARGGMGRVLAGRESTLDREVAIKLLLPGAKAERFLTESKITARLPHPNIPPVYALGSLNDGSPFLAMKLIRGKTLAALLGERETPAEGLSRFLQIFEQIAQAVGFAHAQGFIHRDLKLANVMVGAFGEVQVMDWGLAREARSSDASPGRESGESVENPEQTQVGSILGTPAYMAPEQARGEVVDARADVFALGAILCEVLTGDRPWGHGQSAVVIARAARGDLSSCFALLDNHEVDTELRAVAKKCLATNADERYPDAQAVADAVAAYRNGVEQRLRQAETERATAVAREQEQRRRRRALQWAGGIIAAVLILGTSVSVWQAVVAGIARGEAVQRAIGEKNANDEAQASAKMEKLAKEDAEDQKEKALNAAREEKRANAETQRQQEILFTVFEHIDLRKIKAGNETLEAFLAKKLLKVADRLIAEQGHDPVRVAELQNRLGRTLIGLGYSQEALPLIRSALETWTKDLGLEHRDTISARANYAMALQESGEIKPALEILVATLAERKKQFGDDDLDTLRSMNNLGTCLVVSGEIDRAIPHLKSAWDGLKKQLGAADPVAANAANNLAICYEKQAQYDQALKLHRETLEARKEKLGIDHVDTLVSLNNLAFCLQSMDQRPEAFRLFEECLERRTRVLGSLHPDVFHSQHNLARAYHADRKTGLALPLYQKSYAGMQSARGPNHPQTLISAASLAGCYNALGRADLAIPLFEETLKSQKSKYKSGHPDILVTTNNLAMAYVASKNFDKALPVFEECVKIRLETQESGHPDVLLSRNNLARCYQNLGQTDKAIEQFRTVFETLEHQGFTNPNDPIYILNYVTCLEASGRDKSAETIRRTWLGVLREKSGPKSVAVGNELALLGINLLRQHNFPEAEKVMKECLAIRLAFAQELKSSAPWQIPNAQSMVGEALLGQGKVSDAEPYLSKGLAGLQECESSIPPQNRPWISDAIERLLQLAIAAKQPDEIEKWRTQRAKYPAEIAPLPHVVK